jgi:hypothetical protein
MLLIILKIAMETLAEMHLYFDYILIVKKVKGNFREENIKKAVNFQIKN